MDTLSPKERSRVMSLVRGKNTKPELAVRRLIHRLGYRYRLHRRDLPGSPDLVFSSRRAVIFVSGCYWHRHNCPNGRRLPKTRTSWWRGKLESNRCRDISQQRKLRRAGWRVMVVWECQIRVERLPALQNRIVRFLDMNNTSKARKK
jgi:DNA mismatch endonuclease (patch repair protein)